MFLVPVPPSASFEERGKAAPAALLRQTFERGFYGFFEFGFIAEGFARPENQQVAEWPGRYGREIRPSEWIYTEYRSMNDDYRQVVALVAGKSLPDEVSL